MSAVRLPAALALCLLGVTARAAPPLPQDPFARPAFLEAAPGTPAQAARLPLLELRAVLAAGKSSLADVGGRIVRIGEEIDGFKLVAVHEGGAVFERGGRAISIDLQASAAAPAAEAPPDQGSTTDAN
jgi:hypothetical protein